MCVSSSLFPFDHFLNHLVPWNLTCPNPIRNTGRIAQGGQTEYIIVLVGRPFRHTIFVTRPLVQKEKDGENEIITKKGIERRGKERKKGENQSPAYEAFRPGTSQDSTLPLWGLNSTVAPVFYSPIDDWCWVRWRELVPFLQELSVRHDQSRIPISHNEHRTGTVVVESVETTASRLHRSFGDCRAVVVIYHQGRQTLRSSYFCQENHHHRQSDATAPTRYGFEEEAASNRRPVSSPAR